MSWFFAHDIWIRKKIVSKGQLVLLYGKLYFSFQVDISNIESETPSNIPTQHNLEKNSTEFFHGKNENCWVFILFYFRLFQNHLHRKLTFPSRQFFGPASSSYPRSTESEETSGNISPSSYYGEKWRCCFFRATIIAGSREQNNSFSRISGSRRRSLFTSRLFCLRKRVRIPSSLDHM